MKLEFAPRALRDATRCAAWWRSHRPSAPTLFMDELAAALDQVRGAPRAGVVYEAAAGREYRRLLMPETAHHVYYRLVGERIRILAIWSAVRGRSPKLP